MELFGGDLACGHTRQVCQCRFLEILIIDQRLAAFPPSLLNWKLFKSLVMAGETPNLAGKVNAFPIEPLPRDLIACCHAPKTLDLERRKISEDHQLVYAGG